MEVWLLLAETGAEGFTCINPTKWEDTSQTRGLKHWVEEGRIVVEHKWVTPGIYQSMLRIYPHHNYFIAGNWNMRTIAPLCPVDGEEHSDYWTWCFECKSVGG
jgi:hypothetical protein